MVNGCDVLGTLLLDLLTEVDEHRTRIEILEARIVDLEADNRAYSEIAHLAIHRSYDLRKQRNAYRARLYEVLNPNVRLDEITDDQPD